MKQIGIIKHYISKDSKNWILIGSSRYMYEEPFKANIVTYEYSEIKYSPLNYIFFYGKDSIFPWGKKCVKYNRGYEQLYIYPNEKLFIKDEWMEVKYVTFDRLSDSMNINDFIKYLKDKGINICPIQK